MSLYIRDDDVDALAKKVQQVTKAPTKTEAVRRALENELAPVEKLLPLKGESKRFRTVFEPRWDNKPGVRHEEIY